MSENLFDRKFDRRTFLKAGALVAGATAVALALGKEVSSQPANEIINGGGVEYLVDRGNVNALGMGRIMQITTAMNSLALEGKIPASKWLRIKIDGGEGGAVITPMFLYPHRRDTLPRIILPDCYQLDEVHAEEGYQPKNLAGTMSTGFTTVGPEDTRHWKQQDDYASMIIERVLEQE